MDSLQLGAWVLSFQQSLYNYTRDKMVEVNVT